MNITSILDGLRAGAEFMSTPHMEWEFEHQPLVGNPDTGPRPKINALRNMLILFRRGPLYIISDDMTTLIEHSARSMPDEEIMSSDLPCGAGVALFETPRPFSLVMTEAGLAESPGLADDLDFAGWSWQPYVIGPDRGQSFARALIDVAGHENDGESLGINLISLARVRRTGAIVVGVQDWFTFGRKVTEFEDPSWNGPEDVPRRMEPRAFWRISQQTLSRVDDFVFPRTIRRGLEKNDRPIPLVKTVTLRRVDPRESHVGEESPVEWSHRWIVSGFWRNQPFGPARGQRRQQWIAPFVKGPSDKPLVLKKEVRMLVR